MNLHPMFAAILEAHASAPAVVEAATVFRATLGMRREFKTPEEAAQYDEGYRDYILGAAFHCRHLSAPFTTGWLDSEKAYEQQREDIDDDRREKRAAREDL